MSFSLDDYVDVAERIRIFREKHPEGSLQSEVKLFHRDDVLVGVLCRAEAFRTDDDSRPGVGHSYLQVPGKTPYTKDSEVENAETSAWGRAIVAVLAADTKKIASTQEVRARHDSPGAGTPAAPAGASSSFRAPADDPSAAAVAETAAAHPNGEFTFASGKHAGKTLGQVPRDYLSWYLANGPKQDVKEAIAVYMGLTAEPVDEFGDVPF